MRRKHQKHSLKAKTSDAFETDVVRSDSVSGTISASGHEIWNTKYEICKTHKFQKIGRGTYQSGVGAFLKSRRRIYQWKSLNLNFCRHMIWLRNILKNSHYLNTLHHLQWKSTIVLKAGTFGFVKSQNLSLGTFAEWVGCGWRRWI